MDSTALEGQSFAGAGAGAQRSAQPGPQTQASVWDQVAASAQFARLMKAKKRYIIPLFLFFAAYYLLLPLFTGYAPQLLGRKIAGMSVAYIFGLSLILLAWAMVWFYVVVAARFDAMAQDIVAQANSTTPSATAAGRDRPQGK